MKHPVLLRFAKLSPLVAIAAAIVGISISQSKSQPNKRETQAGPLHDVRRVIVQKKDGKTHDIAVLDVCEYREYPAESTGHPRITAVTDIDPAKPRYTVCFVTPDGGNIVVIGQPAADQSEQP